VSGLTPDLEEAKAIAVALKRLRIRCPACSAIVEVTQPLGSVLLQTQEKVSGLVEEALQAEMARRSAKGYQQESKGQQDGAANGSQPIRSETNRTSSAAGSRR
jgi:hypothetical protein